MKTRIYAAPAVKGLISHTSHTFTHTYAYSNYNIIMMYQNPNYITCHMSEAVRQE